MDVTLNEHNQDEFLEQFPIGSFLQSRFWKHFLTVQGKKTWQLNVYDNSRLVAHCVLYTTKLPFGKSYLYAPKGPIVLPTLNDDERTEALELILSQIRDITIATRKREEIFCRIEPNIPVPLLTSGPIKQIAPIQPATTIYRELNISPEELFTTFKEKTRYNIRLAKKKGLTTHWSSDEKGLKIFQGLLNKSASRQKIKTHDKRYYALLIKAGKEFDAVHINWAEHNGDPIAANLYVMNYPTMTYLHGGFDYKYRHLMAPYLLQWEAMKLAYDKRFEYYDFWGYEPSDGSKPLWAGFSRFKKGFGGKVVETPGCFDFIYNQVWYNGYTKLKRLKK